MNELTNLSLFNENTGEIIQYLTKDELEFLRNNYTSAPKGTGRINDKNIRRSDDLFCQFINETCGSFYFNYYNKLEMNQYSFRFMYICTFMNYKGYLEFGNAKNEGRLCTKKDLMEILALGKSEYYKTFNYLLDNNLIKIDENDFICVNTEICIKGKIKSKKEVVRMFDSGIREIYKNSLPKEHKKLSVLIKILPYIHHDLNVICQDPTEEYAELIKPLTLTELAKTLNYSTTQKLKKGLMDLKVNGEPVIMISKINNKDMLVVNPKIYYKGGNIEKMEGIINLFKIAK